LRAALLAPRWSPVVRVRQQDLFCLRPVEWLSPVVRVREQGWSVAQRQGEVVAYGVRT
jgi:hypothetical protein